MGGIKLFPVLHTVGPIPWVFTPGSAACIMGVMLFGLLGEFCAAVYSSSWGQRISTFLLEDVSAQSVVAHLCCGFS